VLEDDGEIIITGREGNEIRERGRDKFEELLRRKRKNERKDKEV
jgi:hypothetical protein